MNKECHTLKTVGEVNVTGSPCLGLKRVEGGTFTFSNKPGTNFSQAPMWKEIFLVKRWSRPRHTNLLITQQTSLTTRPEET